MAGASKRGLVRRDDTDVIIMRGPLAASSTAPPPYSIRQEARQRDKERAAMQAEDHLERLKEERERAAMSEEDPCQYVTDDCLVQ